MSNPKYLPNDLRSPRELLNAALDLLPNATMGEDNQGQIIIYTGYTRTEDGEDITEWIDDDDEEDDDSEEDDSE